MVEIYFNAQSDNGTLTASEYMSPLATQKRKEVPVKLVCADFNTGVLRFRPRRAIVLVHPILRAVGKLTKFPRPRTAGMVTEIYAKHPAV